MFHSKTAVHSAILLVLAGFLLLSCSNGGDPVSPSESDLAVSNPEQNSMELEPGLDPSSEAGLVTPFPKDESLRFAPDEVLVTFNDGIVPTGPEGRPLLNAATVGVQILANHGLSVKRVIPLDWGTVYRLQIMDSADVLTKVAELKAIPEVDIAEPNYIVEFCEAPYFPNDPLWENPNDDDDDPRSNVFEQFGPSKIGASVVWNDTKGSPDVVVCVLDTGVNWWHEDLEDVMWHNEDEIPDNGVDDDDNGYIDDYWGWDTNGDDNDITEYNPGGSYHGSACSGVVAATQDNGLGCSGIAPGVRVMGIKCDLSGGGGYTSSVIEGVQYASDNGANVISMSFRTYNDSETMHATMDAAWANGVLLCGGAGNEDSSALTYPATWDSVIEVGATITYGPRWSYTPIDEVRITAAGGYGWGSNWGVNLEVMAYGEHYITTYGEDSDTYWDGTDDFFFGGTSNATPMVAGAFGLLKSYFPGADSVWLRERMRETSDDLYTLGFDYNSGYGRINLIRACYGVDRFTSEEDVDGFVDLAPHDFQQYDSLNYATSGDYIDTEDLYKLTAENEGCLLFNLDIFTWGENLDLQIYSDPSMTPEFLVDESTGPNHADTSIEAAGVLCNPGETYYIRVFPAAPGDSTAYGLTAMEVDNYIDMEIGGYDPGFIHVGANKLPVGYLDFTVGFSSHITELLVSMQGNLPIDKLTGLHLYRDSNLSGSYNSGDTLVASGQFNDTNRIFITGFNDEIKFRDNPARYFLVADISGVTDDAEFGFSLTSYKDVSTSEKMEVHYNRFPLYFGSYIAGVDSEHPAWDSTVGVQEVNPLYESAMVKWNAATDVLTPPVKYNVYWTQELPFDFISADHAFNVNSWNDSEYDRAWKINGLNNDEEYFVAVRTEDQVGNEDENILYLAVTPSMVSDPTSPQVIGELNTAGNAWEVVADPANQRVFIADLNNGVVVVDVSDPTDPTQTDHVAGSGMRGIDYDGSLVYTAGNAGLVIIDPDAPGGAVVLGSTPFTQGLDVCVVGNWCYVTNYGNTILPVDVSNPADPVPYDEVDSNWYGYGMDSQDGYLYVATYYKPRVYSLTDPSAPEHLITFGGNGSYEIDAQGNRLYVTYWGGNRFSIYSLANPANPVYLGGLTSNSGSGGSDLVMFNGYLYFGTNNHYIEVIDVTAPGSLFEIGQVATGGPDGMDTDGTFIYSAENYDGLKVLL